MENPLIFNIQNYSLNDGPGIRTIVFFKGCPMRCRWCCNPESQEYDQQMSYIKKNCIGEKECGFCQQSCHQKAISFDEEGKAKIERSLCTDCLSCTKTCPAMAMKQQGKPMEISEIIDQVLRQELFYHHGEGGLTVSGGEPLSHGDWLIRLLKEAKKHRLHTAIETCGYAPYEVLKEALNYLDVIFFDIKSMNDEKHKLYTGKSNQKILDNFKQLVQDTKTTKIIARTPVIPGFNDTIEELEEIQHFIAKGKDIFYEMLPYHRFGKGKYEMLGRTYPMGDALLSEEIKTYIQKQNEKWRKKECQS